MSYSLDLRERAVKYVQDGGRQSDASHLFGVTTRTLYNWLHRDNLSPTIVKSRKCKLSKTALAAHIRDYPDALLRVRAKHFEVTPSGIWRSLHKMNIVKKNDEI